MAGVPGKGGAKGRSGRKPIGDIYKLRLPDDVRQAAMEAGPDRVRDILREQLGVGKPPQVGNLPE